MKKLLPLLLGIIFILTGTDSAKACSPVHTPFNQLLDNFDPTLNTAVEGYFIQCEMYEMESGIDPRFIGAKNSRILFLNKDRSKNGKLVTPIFHGEGVSISGSKTVMFNHYVSSDKSSLFSRISLFCNFR